MADPPGRVRSNSYDESFLNRSPETKFNVLTTRANEAPPRLQYPTRLKFDDDGPCDAPPTAILSPQSEDTSPRFRTSDMDDDVGAEKPPAIRLTPTTSSSGAAKHDIGDDLPFDEGNSTKAPLDRFYLAGPRIAPPKRIELSDFAKDMDESSIDGAPVQDETTRKLKDESRGGVMIKKDDEDDDSLFEFAEKQDSPAVPNVVESFSDCKVSGVVKNKEEDGFDGSTQGNQTIQSSYSKSAESEVEDLINDILLIGSSNDSRLGKRKVKQGTNTENQDGTDTTLENVSEDKESNGDDPLTSVWNYLFDGGKNKDEGNGTKQSLATTLVTCPSSAGELFDYASELFLGGDPKGSYKSQSDKNPENDSKSTRASQKRAEMIDVNSLASAPSLEEDLRLVELAVEAARSIHRLRGCAYDETYEIDFSEDIKFTVVDLELPLGLIFQEHRVGCWVTKVLPNGSASMIGKVQIGDQLAAIDGRSAINMSVGDIAALVKDKIASVELTFMRYVGPIRPPLGGVSEEGYEVNPGNLLKRGVNSQSSSPVRQTSYTQQRIESSTSMQRVVSSRDSQGPEGKPQSGEAERRRFRLFGKRKNDK